jgi:hypothetical protein
MLLANSYPMGQNYSLLQGKTYPGKRKIVQKWKQISYQSGAAKIETLPSRLET